MADADVSAMFQSRKAKKGKKKFKTFSANKLVSRLEAGGLADGGTEEPRGTLGMSNTGLESGEWVDDDEPIRPTATLLGSEVSDFNPSAEAAAAKRALKPKAAGGLAGRKNVGQADQELAKQEFHTVRAKAVVEADKKASQVGEEVKPAPAPAKMGWRARHAATKGADKNGQAALKELDNESVFPTLGGPVGGAKPKAGGPQAAWGQVEEKVLSAVKAVIWVPLEPHHLGEDFYPCEIFEGEKGGYGFSLGEKGLGYYWLSSAEPAKEEEEEVVEADVLKPSATAWKPRSGRSRNTELPPDGDDESAAAPPPPAPIGIGAGAAASSTDEDSRFKPSATAWRPRSDRPRNTEAPPAESDEEDATPAAGAAVEVEEEEDADRFAGLKKKKKKKKSTAEVAEE